MTVWERLFGTPERAASALEELDLMRDQIGTCYLMDVLGDIKCANCFNEYDRYGCERKEMTMLQWLKQELKVDSHGDEDA